MCERVHVHKLNGDLWIMIKDVLLRRHAIAAMKAQGHADCFAADPAARADAPGNVCRC